MGLTASFEVSTGGEARHFSAAARDVQGVLYISLAELLAGVGGDCRVLPARVQMEYGMRTVLVGLNSVGVNTSQQSFDLSHPVVLVEGKAWMAKDDVPPFFERAFVLEVSEQQKQLPTPVAAQGNGRVVVQELPLTEEWVAPAPESPTPAEPLTAEPVSVAPTSPAQGGAPTPAAILRKHIERVVIDPGHGGNDLGTVGAGGLAEKTLSLSVAKRLAAHLKETTPLKLFMTRDEDSDLTVRERVAFANRQQGDLLISLHAGASFSSHAHGVAVFSPMGKDKLGTRAQRLAEGLAVGLGEATESSVQGVRVVPLRLQEGLGMPCVLVEVGYLTNTAEEALLQTEAYQERLVQGIVKGITQVLQDEEEL